MRNTVRTVTVAAGLTASAAILIPAAVPAAGRTDRPVTVAAVQPAPSPASTASTRTGRPSVPATARTAPPATTAAARPAPAVHRLTIPAGGPSVAVPAPSTTAAAPADPTVTVQYPNGQCGQTSQSEATQNHLTVVASCTAPPPPATPATGLGPNGPLPADPVVTARGPDGYCVHTGQHEASSAGLTIVPASDCPARTVRPRQPFDPWHLTPAQRTAALQYTRQP